MKTYQYQLVRYIHDRVTGEFANIGVIVFHPESRFLKSRFITKYGRISQFFNNVNGTYLLNTLRNFEKQIWIIAKRSNELFYNYKNINDITEALLPKDDSALVCSDVFYAIDIDFDSALLDLFERMVDKYYPETEEAHDDKFVWKNVYKKYFDQRHITKNLRPHTIQTSHDVIEFDKAWKNEHWHCYQPISFDLKHEDTIKNKVYKWSGILSELENTSEIIHVHFLTKGPSRHKKVQKFIDDTFLGRQSSQVRVSMVKESEADKFADAVQKEMSLHTNE